jgi:hypothetical protein
MATWKAGLCLAACMIAGSAGTVRAAVISTTIPPENTYDSGYSYAVGGSGTSWGEVDIAARFVVPSMSDRYLDSIEVACRSYSSSNISDLIVMITADNSGNPGTVLGSVQVTAPASSAIVTADFGNDLQLAAGGAYWVRVSTAAASGQDFWHISSPKLIGDCKWSDNNGQGWHGYSELPAFRVNGVPEPATISLLALGGLAMLRRGKAGTI